MSSSEEETYSTEEGSSNDEDSGDVTIEDSESEGNVEESIVVPKKNKRKVILPSDSEDEEEEEMERMALSPRARMSITGIRPADLSDDDSSEIDYSDKEGDSIGKSNNRSALSIQESENSQNFESANDDIHEQSSSTNVENTQIQEKENHDDGDDEEEINSSGEEDDEDEEEEDDSFTTSKRNSFIAESAEESSAKENSTKTDVSTKSSSDKTVSDLEAESPRQKILEGEQISNSPLHLSRYSSHFVNAIKENLSSTIYQPSPKVNPDNSSSSVVNSSDSDVLVVSNTKDATIELFTSEDEDNDQKEEQKPIEILSPELKKNKNKNNLVQPKITHVAGNVVGATPKSKKPQLPQQYVSQDFYRKETFKLDEMKMEFMNAQKLVDKIAHNLPDGGKQLKLRCERLKNDINIKQKYLDSLVIEDMPGSSMPLSIKAQQKENRMASKSNSNSNSNSLSNAPNWDDLSAAVNEIKPTHTGARGLQTFNTQKSLTVERLKEMHSSLEKRPTEDTFAEDPKGLKVSLMPHQKHALAWMTWREKQKPRGGILADDMGLGKTLTMISMVLAAKIHQDENEDPEEKRDSEDSEDEEAKENRGWVAKGRKDYYNGGTLVICPASLIRQWECEVDSKVSRHKLTVCVHHGNNREAKPKHLRTYDMVVTTYNIVAREHKSNGALFGLKWNRIILDEAHIVRNHKAQSSVAVCELKGKYRWALTGTPIQNKETDVYALMKFLRCSPFDDLAHWKKWIDNKSAGGQMRLNTLMQSLMLRRTKAQLQTKGELLCLPEKEIKLIEVVLDKDEMNVYQMIMTYSRSLFAQYLRQRAERNTDLMYKEDGNRPTFLQTKDPNDAYYNMHKKFTKLYHGSKEQVKSHEILVLLLRLRQICCHPGLIDAMLDDEESLMESDQNVSQPEIDLLEQLNKLAIKDNSLTANSSLENQSLDEPMKPEEAVLTKATSKVLQRSNPVFDVRRPSTKMLKVLKVVKKCVLQTDDKAIIVSQWTSVLNILKSHLEEQGVQTLSLNGNIPVKNRQEIVTEFNKANNNKKILLLSLTAGGVGLNLVGANHLLLIDLHWNPQLEAQAQDRIYRVGQKKNVIIYKFMCKDTVEERIKALQDRKLEIANGVLTGAKATEGSKLSIDDLKGLFGM